MTLLTEEKRCPKCGMTKPLSEFHRNKRMKDGHAADCKPCAIARASEWQRNNRERHNLNDKRSRDRNPARFQERLRKWRDENPEKAKAHKAVLDAVYTGRLPKPDTCEDCGKNTERERLHGHHPDYAKPLDVEWLCPLCHKGRHK